MLGLAVSVAGCGTASLESGDSGKPAAARSRRRSNPKAPGLISPARDQARAVRVLLKGVSNPQAYAAGGSLYVAQDVTPAADARTEVLSELMRISPASGRILASRRLGSEFDQALLTDGELWVSSTPWTGARSATWLWRLDPRWLAVDSRTILPGPGHSSTAGSMAVAGAQLWVAAKTLSGVSLTTGRVQRTTGVVDRGGIQVAADPAGRILLASVGSVHPTWIERLDSHTGALRAKSESFWSVTRPLIGGISDGGAWISDATGMAGRVFRLNVDTMKATRTQAPAIDTNGIRAQVIDGILWVTQTAGRTARNYCGDPATGRSRAPIALPTSAEFLTADTSHVYYEPVDTSPAEVGRIPTDPGCRS